MRRFTPEVRAALLAHIRTGSTLADACEVTGLSVNTAKTWLRRGRREITGDYADFVAAIDQAREAAATAEMTGNEFQAHLAAAVRRGSVQAMKLWWEVNAGDDRGPDPYGFAELDGPYRLHPRNGRGAQG